MTAVYPSADGKNNVVLSVDTQPPDGHVSPAPKPVSVAGRPGQFFRLPPGIPVAADEMTLVWERKPGQWVSIGGDGRFGTEAAVLALAATVVEQPQPIPLQLRLAPAGWKLYAFKADVIITICEGNRHDTCIDVIRVAHVDPNFARDLIGVRRSSTVQVNGRPALLVETVDGWMLQAPLPDGSAFHLHAPGFLTNDQVIAIAAQVSLS
jgi:hypothetical protein